MSVTSFHVDPETVRRFDRPGPRYTSYPTAVEFHGGVRSPEYRQRLAAADAEGADVPLSLYVHIPFCAKHCSYCGCHVIATPKREIAASYLDYVGRELALAAAELPRRRSLAQMHWGGGTPTYLDPDQLERLHGLITAHFRPLPDAEVAIEVDPRVTSREHLEMLHRLGFNRLSFGVQDFTPAVQAAIGRGQTFAQTQSLLATAREIGFGEGINLDLVYGLPEQTEATFRSSMKRVVELMPDRLAIYSFAYVPWIRPNQRRIDEQALPQRDAKLGLYLVALETLLAAGYEPIGMDHFALPTDELARAAREGRLDRNFMGYTVKPTSTMIAFGVSGIGEVAGGFFANEKKLSRYYAALDAGELPVERGYLLDDDDEIRQFVIRQLMCNFRVAKREVERRFGIDFDDYFAGALAGLDEVLAEGFVAVDGEAVTVAPAGRLFVRNVCMAFDRYLEAKRSAERPVFSRTV
ncbi:MAG TPA: oxygen-independent coproporphyrinogen III oxidase [Thermoanaerobaculia bacterium]